MPGCIHILTKLKNSGVLIFEMLPQIAGSFKVIVTASAIHSFSACGSPSQGSKPCVDFMSFGYFSGLALWQFSLPLIDPSSKILCVALRFSLTRSMVRMTQLSLDSILHCDTCRLENCSEEGKRVLACG